LSHGAKGSFFAISKSRIDHQLKRWNTELPNVKPYYAVKCNPEPWLIEWLAKSSQPVGFDCASAREITTVKDTVVDPDIIFANPCKKHEDILHAVRSSVDTTVIDSYEEVDKLHAWSGSVLVRIRVEDSGSKIRFGQKFGADLSDVRGIIAYAKSKGLETSGISFHVGSGCEYPSQFYDAILLANSVFPYGKPPIIDIGGGFTNKGFEAAAEQIRRTRGYIQYNINLIAEPGRFFAASSHDLFVKVIGKKPNPSGGFRYTIDESLYGQFSCIPYDQARPQWIRIRGPEENSRRKVQCILYGRTCDSVDMIAKGYAEELEEGDWLWFPHMGAYTTVTSTEFNGFPKPLSIVLDSEELPDPSFVPNGEWPSNLEYVNPVKVPF
jgi:ornithine decarboxylase